MGRGGEVRGCSRGLEGWRREHQTLYRRWNWRGRIGRPKKDCNRQEETWCYTKSSIIILSLLVSHTCFWQPGIVSAVLWVCRMGRHLNQQYFQELPYMQFFCCSIFLRVFAVSVFSLASRCPQFGVLYLGVPQDWVSLSLDTECFHFGAFYVACGILWPKETFLWQQIRARLHQETSVTPSAELNCDHH